jgi:simple sugar transport system ATP-binding protein
VTFLFISHFNDEILNICDAVTVLRDGELLTHCEDVGSLNSSGSPGSCWGANWTCSSAIAVYPLGEEGIRLSGVRGERLDVAQLDIRAGRNRRFHRLAREGQELARSLFAPLQAGRSPLHARRRPRAADARPGLWASLSSDDRRRDGVVGHLSIRENIALSSLRQRIRRGLVDRTGAAGLFLLLHPHGHQGR